MQCENRANLASRIAGICEGQICAWANFWANPPPGSPPLGNAPEETPAEIDRRCRGQLTVDGPWPLSRTEDITAQYEYRRVE